MEQRRITIRLGEAAAQLGAWAGQQVAALDGLARLAPAIQNAVARAVAELRPALEAAAARIRHQPTPDIARKELVTLRMAVFQRLQRRFELSPSLSMEQRWAQKAQSEEKRQRAAVRAIPNADVQRVLRQERGAQNAQEGKKSMLPARSRLPGPSQG